MKKFILTLIMGVALVNMHPLASSAQHPEIGFSVVLSGALMFGPYIDYWFDDHNNVEISIMAGWEHEFIFPLALNAGYSYYFGDSDWNWRPSLSLQYSLLMPPDSVHMSMLSLLPGVQYRWDDTQQDTRLKIWVSTFLGKEKIMPWRVMPIGVQFDYGYKFK